jgi:hypothetical protein
MQEPSSKPVYFNQCNGGVGDPSFLSAVLIDSLINLFPNIPLDGI